MKKKLSLKKKLILKLLKLLSFKKEKMAHYAYKNTNLYKKLYNVVIGNENKTNIKKINFTDLPLLKKQFVFQSKPFDMLSEKLNNKVFKYAETTGSTGSPTPSFFTRKEFKGSLILSKLTTFNNLLKDMPLINKNAVCGLACGFTIANSSFHQILDEHGFLTINIDARTTISPPHRVARLLSRFMPSVIVASEIDFLSWMKVLKEEYSYSYDYVVKNLQALISTAELCSQERSKQIEKEFNISHIDNYSCVEGFFSLPCLCGEKHILPIYHTEILDDRLDKSSEFGDGRFAFTNLLRKSTPFVRYLLDDYVTIYPSKCEYGFKKSIMPHGRYELTVNINGKKYGVRHFEAILFKNYLFGEYQIRVLDNEIQILAEDYIEKKIDYDQIINDYEKKFGLKTSLKVVDYGKIRNYREIRQTKPLFRLIDKRLLSTQEVPMYV